MLLMLMVLVLYRCYCCWWCWYDVDVVGMPSWAWLWPPHSSAHSKHFRAASGPRPTPDIPGERLRVKTIEQLQYFNKTGGPYDTSILTWDRLASGYIDKVVLTICYGGLTVSLFIVYSNVCFSLSGPRSRLPPCHRIIPSWCTMSLLIT